MQGEGQPLAILDDLIAGVEGITSAGSLLEYVDRVRMMVLESRLSHRINASLEEIRKLDTLGSLLERLSFTGEFTSDLDDQQQQDIISLAAELFEHAAVLGASLPTAAELRLKAAVTYALGSYEANSTILAKDIVFWEFPTEPDTLESFRLGVFQIVADVLSRRFVQALEHSEILYHRVDQKIEELGLKTVSELGEFYVLLRLVVAVKKLSEFMTGQVSRMSISEDLDRGVRLAVQGGLSAYWWLLTRLRSVFNRMIENSVWTLLLSHLGSDYINAFVHNTGIFELWESQAHAIKNGLVSDESTGFVARMPTSAGKTVLADIAILKALHQHPGQKCVYVTPSNALVNQVAQHLRTLLREVAKAVTAIPGGLDLFDESLAMVDSTDVLVLTPEKLDMFVRRQQADVLNASLFIFDEVHNVGEDTRGLLEELLVARLLYLRADKPPRLLFLSALIPNVSEFQAWLGPKCGIVDYATTGRKNWRPARLVKGAIVARQGRQALPPSNRVVNVVHGQLQYLNHQGQLVDGPVVWTIRDTNVQHVQLAHTAAMFAKLGTVLVYRHSIKDVENLCEQHFDLFSCALQERMSRNQPNAEVSKAWSDLMVAVEHDYGKDSPLYRYVRAGYAYHHAGLTPQVKLCLENAIRAGVLGIIVCSPTLAEGFDSPVHTVIIDGLLGKARPDDSGNYRRSTRPLMPVNAYLNLSGRAGRALRETTGYVLLMHYGTQHPTEQYLRSDDSAPIQSVLQLLSDWLDSPSEELRLWDRQDSILGRYYGFVLSIYGSGIDELDKIKELLSHTLYKVQCPDNVNRLAQFTSRIVEEIRSDPLGVGGEALAVMGTTGLSPWGAKNIWNHVQALLDGNLEEGLVELLSHDYAQLVSTVLASDPELEPPVRPDDYSELDHGELFGLWISGTPLTEFDDHQPSSFGANYWSKYIDRVVRYRLAWGLSAYYTIFRFAAERREVWSEIPVELREAVQFAPAYAKFGVNNRIAVLMRLEGLTDRALAIKLGHKLKYYFEAVGYDSASTRFLLERVRNWSFRDWNVPVNTCLQTRTDLSVLDAPKTPSPGWIVFDTRIKGLHYYLNRSTRLQEGDEVRLEAEPHNPVDPNAIRLTVGGSTVGYVDAQIARELAPYVRGNRKYVAFVSRVSNESRASDEAWATIIVETGEHLITI